MRTILFRVIAVLQIAGGLYGFFPLMHRVIAGGPLFELVTSCIGAALFALSVVSGVLLLERGPANVVIARWVQGLQIPLIGTPWFSYAMQIGGASPLVLTVQRPLGLHIAFDLPTWHWMLAPGGPRVSEIGVNLLALAAWLVLRFMR